MKDAPNASSPKFDCSLEVVVSEKNLILFNEIEGLADSLFSQFPTAKICLSIDRVASERVRIKAEIKRAESDELLLSTLELFLHYLGNVRVYYKKVDYRIVS